MLEPDQFGSEVLGWILEVALLRGWLEVTPSVVSKGFIPEMQTAADAVRIYQAKGKTGNPEEGEVPDHWIAIYPPPENDQLGGDEPIRDNRWKPIPDRDRRHGEGL